MNRSCSVDDGSLSANNSVSPSVSSSVVGAAVFMLLLIARESTTRQPIVRVNIDVSPMFIGSLSLEVLDGVFDDDDDCNELCLSVDVVADMECGVFFR